MAGTPQERRAVHPDYYMYIPPPFACKSLSFGSELRVRAIRFLFSLCVSCSCLSVVSTGLVSSGRLFLCNNV